MASGASRPQKDWQLCRAFITSSWVRLVILLEFWYTLSPDLLSLDPDPLTLELKPFKTCRPKAQWAGGVEASVFRGRGRAYESGARVRAPFLRH